MPGLPILYRILKNGYSEPTKIYAVVEKDSELELHKEMEWKQATLDEIVYFLKEMVVAPNRPVIVEDAEPRVAHELKSRGIRVK